MSLYHVLTTQIVRGEITVEQAQSSLLAYAYRGKMKEDPGAGTLAQIKDRAIEAALRRNGWNYDRTALELGVCRTTLYRRHRR